MNSFEIDLKRAILSKGFAAGFILQLALLFASGFGSELFFITVPVAAAFPYSTAWLNEYQSGYIKFYLPRTSICAYISGKFWACGISGGLLELLSCFFFQWSRQDELEINLILIFFSGMLWAVVAAVLAAWSKNRYIAYGGGFVLYYLLVMLYQRYFQDFYCFYPYEWLAPEHIWLFGNVGILLMIGGIILILLCCYYIILGRQLEHV